MPMPSEVSLRAKLHLLTNRIEMCLDGLVHPGRRCWEICGSFAKMQVASSSTVRGGNQRLVRPRSFVEGVDPGVKVASAVVFVAYCGRPHWMDIACVTVIQLDAPSSNWNYSR